MRAARKGKRRRRRTAPRRRSADVVTSNLALHDLFVQQAAAILERAELSDEDKQSILVAMNCPCCGAGAVSFSVKLKPRRPRFVSDGGDDS
jgi:hypothetical protein